MLMNVKSIASLNKKDKKNSRSPTRILNDAKKRFKTDRENHNGKDQIIFEGFVIEENSDGHLEPSQVSVSDKYRDKVKVSPFS